jgi:2-methylisocitrate lyase-like PEP mutase family enzyme
MELTMRKDPVSKAATLRERLAGRDLVTAPGVFDLISAKIADQYAFGALYMTGYGVSASYLGLPDAGLATFTDMAERVGRIAQSTTTPLIADGDTGYGGLLNVRHTIRAYERAGAAAIQLEDQEFPKRCGHTLGRRVVPMEDMVAKIRVAVDTRSDPDFIIIARTDARTSLGLDEALRRGEAYAAAGADVLFIESPESEAEMERICRSFDVPVLANMVEGGRSPVLGAERLRGLGYRIAIFPATGFLAVAATLHRVYSTVERDGSSVALDVPLRSFGQFSSEMGFDDVWAFDRKYGTGTAEPTAS